MADNRSFESTLHDIVYSIDAGTGLKIIRVALYILILLVVVMVYTATQFRGLKTEEAMDYAQLGRNLSFQNGLVTKTVRPLTMWKMEQRTPNENPMIGQHPDMFHPPAYPALLSVGFSFFEMIGVDPFELPKGGGAAVLPAEQWIIVPLNHMFCLLTGLLVFSMGKRMFSREIGFLGMTIYYLSDLVWKDSVSGLNIPMAVFFIAAAFLTMVISMLNKRDGEPKLFWVTPFIISIVCAAIAFLTRYIALAAVPGLCLFAWLMCGRFRGGTRFVLIFVVLYMVMISPWLVRNYRVSGNPMGMVGYTALVDSPGFEDNALAREYHPDLSSKRVTDKLKHKWILNYSENHPNVIPALGGGILMAMFIVTFFYHFVRPQVNYLRWGLGVSLILTVILAGFFSESSIRMIHAFWPFIILYGLAFFYVLVDRLDLGVRLYTIGLKCVIVVLAILPFLMTLLPPHENNPYPPYYSPIIGHVGGMLNEREVLVTDMPWASAWYSDRVSILLPRNLEQFYEINDYKQYISGIFFSSITTDRSFARDLLTGSESTWLPIFSGRVPPDFPLKELQVYNAQRRDQIFLSDRKRWAERPSDEASESR